MITAALQAAIDESKWTVLKHIKDVFPTAVKIEVTRENDRDGYWYNYTPVPLDEEGKNLVKGDSYYEWGDDFADADMSGHLDIWLNNSKLSCDTYYFDLESGERLAAPPPPPYEGPATVSFGVYMHHIEHGMTVKQLRKDWAKNWNIPKSAVAYRDKERLDEDYVVQPHDKIAFYRLMTEKGTQ